MRYEERAGHARNAAGAALLQLMARKRSNLAVAADVPSLERVLAIADAAGPHIAVLKTHVDMFEAWDAGSAKRLRALADKHGARLVWVGVRACRSPCVRRQGPRLRCASNPRGGGAVPCSKRNALLAQCRCSV